MLLIRLQLALFLFLPVIVTAGNVTWTSPSANEVFGPGDTMIARWTSQVPIRTPNFRLCESNASIVVNGGASCGSSVSPLVQQSAGSYFISLYICRDLLWFILLTPL
jgi:hypothetical protein